jgi:hypothetical protein
MTTDFTRRELAKLAGTGAVALSAATTIGRSAVASEATSGRTTVAQATTRSSEQRAVTSASSDAAMERADELLRQMTVEEKAMQLS